MFRFSSKSELEPRQGVRERYTGCFGKIPAYPEFIRENLSSREAMGLDTWVQEGVSLMTRSLGPDWKEAFLAAPALRFVLVGNRETHTVAGVIAPSQDKGGRAYPFGVFAALDEPAFGDMQALAVVGYSDFIEVADTVVAAAREAGSVREVVTAVGRSGEAIPPFEKRALLAREMEIMSAMSMKNFWVDLLPGADEDARAVFVKTVATTFNTVSRRGPSRVNWGVRLPLPSKGDAMPYVMFWLQLAEALIGGRGWRAQCFWHEGQGGLPPRLSIFFKPVPASYFVSMFDMGRSDGAVLDVIDEMQTNEQDISRLLPFVRSEEMSLVDALNNWRSRESWR